MGDGIHRSYWTATAGPERLYPRLEGAEEAEVAVIGGGIVGALTTLLLTRAGVDVVLLEMDRIGGGTTGNTTGKVTSGHGIIYSKIEKKHGIEVSTAYAAANEQGLDIIRGLVAEHQIECDLEDRTNVIYTCDPEKAGSLRSEFEAALRAGLPATFEPADELGSEVVASIKLPGQAQIHAARFVAQVVDAAHEGGSRIYERSRADGLDEGDPHVVRTPLGEVRAKQVVLASHYPFMDRAMLFPRVYPQRSYAIAGTVPAGTSLPGDMYISIDEPTRSIRTIPDGDRRLLMIGGESHPVGHREATPERYLNLERWAARRYAMETEYRWSAQDGTTADLLPYVGRYRPGASVYVATGFAKWGLTNGAAGARLIADLIQGKENPFRELYDPARLTLRASVPRMLQANAAVAKHMIGDRLAHPHKASFDQLRPGEAAVSDKTLAPEAAYRDPDGVLHKVSAVCTHLGCVVRWNQAETSWDCPCHGSRFDIEGRVLEGPAAEDLKRLD